LGGGSGHEPSHAGWIGSEMPSAAILGGIFAIEWGRVVNFGNIKDDHPTMIYSSKTVLKSSDSKNGIQNSNVLLLDCKH